jgi:hypothetical protein
MVETGNFVGAQSKLDAHGDDSTRDDGSQGAVPEQPKTGQENHRAMVAGNGRRLPRFNLELGDRLQGNGGGRERDRRRLDSHQRHGLDWGGGFNLTLETPAPLQSVTSDIKQAMREAESSGLPVGTLVAIGAAATAVVVVASFLAITYVKFKKFSVTRVIGDSEADVA